MHLKTYVFAFDKPNAPSWSLNFCLRKPELKFAFNHSTLMSRLLNNDNYTSIKSYDVAHTKPTYNCKKIYNFVFILRAISPCTTGLKVLYKNDMLSTVSLS